VLQLLKIAVSICVKWLC